VKERKKAGTKQMNPHKKFCVPACRQAGLPIPPPGQEKKNERKYRSEGKKEGRHKSNEPAHKVLRACLPTGRSTYSTTRARKKERTKIPK